MSKLKNVKRMSCAGAVALGLALGAGATSQHSGSIARSRTLVESGIEAGKAARSSALQKIASRVPPKDFAYLVEHSPDAQFRYEALMYLGNLVSPGQTLPTLSSIARKDTKDLPARAAMFAIYQSATEGKLKTHMKAVEQVAIDCLHHPFQGHWAVRILGLCHTSRSLKILRNLAAGKDELLKSTALEELAKKPQ